jgi:Flp pilus assembly pilin Flp
LPPCCRREFPQGRNGTRLALVPRHDPQIRRIEIGSIKDSIKKTEPIKESIKKTEPQRRNRMNWQNFKRLITEEDGMEMVEWAIVGVVFAVAAAAFWGSLAGNVSGALGKIEAEIAGP